MAQTICRLDLKFGNQPRNQDRLSNVPARFNLLWSELQQAV
jgi:hypothetical protein